MVAVDRSVTRTSDPATRRAARDTVPFAIALVPLSLAIGGASAAAGLSAVEAVFGAVALLAGAAQLAALETIRSDGGVVVAVTVVVLVNLRFVFYGAGVARWFVAASRRQRLLLVFPVVDQTFLLCQDRFTTEGDLAWRRRYYLTVTAVLAGTYIAGQVVGFHLGASLPAALGLHLAAPLAFAGMLAKATRSRADLVAALVAAITVVAVSSVVGPVALPLAVVLGAVGAAVSTRKESS